MNIVLLERFQKDLETLAEEDRARCIKLIVEVPKVMGKPHEHSGIGLRKIHPSGVWEIRFGLGLRLLFTLKNKDLTFVTVGSHDHVRRFLASL